MENGGSNDKPGRRIRGSEVFVGGLQRSVTEDMIHEVFCKCGEIVEIRMMKDQNGVFKGYCFVRFTTKEAALKAQKDKNGMILQGKKIGVAPSTDQDTLFLGNLKKEWNQEELESMVRQAFQDVHSVELALAPPSADPSADKKRQNRGFAFVHFDSHSAASRAFRVASRQDFMLGGKWRPVVDWAQSESEADPDELAKVTIAFVGNLPSNMKEEHLKKLFEPFGKLERVGISRKGNTPVGFVHFTQRSDLEAAIKEMDGKMVEGIDKGPRFKLQVSVAKPADKSKKRRREDSEPSNVAAQGHAPGFVGGYGSLSTAYGDYTDYVAAKHPRLPAQQYGPAETADPYELAVLSLPQKVTEKLLQIFRQGLVAQHEVDLHVLESLRELPESTALTVLDQFAAGSVSEIRNKGAYLASMINRSRKDPRDKGGQYKGSRSVVSGPSGGNLLAGSRDSGLLGVGAAAAPRLSVLDSYGLPGASADADIAGYDGYGTFSSVGMLSSLSGGLVSQPLLSRTPTGLGDAYSIPSYRVPSSSTAVNLGVGHGTPEANAVGKRFRFDPFTGEPFKFDPFTGEPVQPTATSSTPLGGKYFY